jgi:glycosyltransferase involved in cell wall biosynthesis
VTDSVQLDLQILCADLGHGGAARATRRVIEALRASSGVSVRLQTLTGKCEFSGHQTRLPGGRQRLIRASSRQVSRFVDKLPYQSGNPVLHSRAEIRTGLGRELNRQRPDVINIHWLGDGLVSIAEIGRLQAPVVLTLHDMWSFCGAEHYSEDDRYRRGYSPQSRSDTESGVDWNRIVWRRKARHWRRPLHVIAPSRWLGECASSSSLMSAWPVHVIPNPLDPKVWAPADQSAARDALGLPLDDFLVLFGAVGGESQRIKGADLLGLAMHELESLRNGASRGRDVSLVVFGGKVPRFEHVGRLPFPVHHLGRITDDRLLRLVYASADVMVVPSRQEAFGQTASEAQSCGVPVVAFRVGGLLDIVVDGVTGFLVDPFDVKALARAISRLEGNADLREKMRVEARRHAAAAFDPAIVADAYLDVFRLAASQSC